MSGFWSPPLCQDEIAAIEAEVIRTFRLRKPGTGYFKEAIGQILLHSWQHNPADTRIVIYAQPVILSTVLAHKDALDHLDLDDVYQDLVLEVLRILPSFNPDLGGLYTFLLQRLRFRVLDLVQAPPVRGANPARVQHVALTAESAMCDDTAAHTLADFVAYLERLRTVEGPTTGRVITAILEVIRDEKLNLQKQCHLCAALPSRAKLPRVITDLTFQRVVAKYLALPRKEAPHADLDQGRCRACPRLA